MIELPIPTKIVTHAKQMADDMGKISGSFTDGEGTIAGFIGELMVADTIGAEQTNTFEFDLTYHGLLLEVKTKRCSSAPKSDYSCDVACRNLRQKADFYIFTRVMKDFSVCWLLGCIGKYDFFMNARCHEKGEQSFGGFTYSASCLSVPVSLLRPFEELDIVSQIRKEQSVSA